MTMPGFSPKQMEIFKFPYQNIYEALICDGAIRTGKTMCMGLAFIQFAFAYFDRQNFGICGKTVQSCERNVIKPLMALTFVRMNYNCRYNRHSNLLTISRGNKENYFYVYGGKDNSSYTLIQGITLAGVLLDEVALMPQSFVSQATARCSVPGAKMFFNCNPENPQHWFYKEWICKLEKHKAKHLHFLLDDNPSLTEETKSRYHRMYAGAFYQRYILGEWVSAEGLIYPMFDRSRYVLKSTEYDHNGKYWISIDYGTANPMVFLLWRYNPYVRHKIVCTKCYYYNSREDGKDQKTDSEYYTDLEAFVGKIPIEAIVIDPSAASFRTLIRKKHKFRTLGADNDVLNGIRYTAALIQNDFIYFDESCEPVFEEFASYCWDLDCNEDTVVKEYDHAMDAMRYQMQTVMRRELKDVFYQKCS